MPEYDFRIRFNLHERYRVWSDADTLELLVLPAGQSIALRSADQVGKTLKDSATVAVVGKGFPSAENARDAAKRSKAALFWWATERRVGVDFGDGIQRSVVTNQGLPLLEQKYGYPIRNDIHGMDVFEHVENLRFIKADMKLTIGENTESLQQIFGREYMKARELSERKVLAIEIYLSSIFDVSPRSRFLTLMTVIESLLDYSDCSEDQRFLVSQFAAMVKASDIEPKAKASLIGRVNSLGHQSIGQAGREFVMRMVPNQTFGGKAADLFFGDLYEKRSQLVHEGHLDSNSDVSQLVSAAEPFVNQVLLAALR